MRNIYNQGINRNRLWHAALLYTTVNLVYSALPLDFVISVAELEQKYDLGRLEIVPDIHNVRALIKPFALTALRAFPLTLLLCFSRGFKTAVIYSVCFAFLCELIQVPVFTRTASLFHVIASVLGLIVGFAIYRLRVLLQPLAASNLFWFGVASLSCVLWMAIILATADYVVQNPQELEDRWIACFGWPMAGYYYQPEFSALTTLSYKTAVFAWIGSCFGLAVSMTQKKSRKYVHFTATSLMLFIAVATELSQVFLVPHIPDASDVVIYAAIMLLASKFTTGISFRKDSISYGEFVTGNRPSY